MANVALRSPFGAEIIEEVVLTNAPLARVVTQVRFPRLTRLVTGDDVANAVAIALADDYPAFNESREVSITLTPEGVTQSPTNNRVWHLVSPDKAWQISFGAEFLALHTSAYTSREEFVARVSAVLEIFSSVVSVPSCDRVGVRYINRVDLAEVSFEDLKSLVRPEMLGGLAVPLDGVKLMTAMNEALYDMAPEVSPRPGAQELAQPIDGLQARWGLLPGGAQLDITLPPLPRPSWMLDLDSFRNSSSVFTTPAVSTQVRELAERAYQYFRWVVTNEFLTKFGA